MFEVYAQDYRITIQEIPLGNQGEDMARCLVIDITDAVNEFGSGGTVSVRNKRNGDELPYFCTNVSTVTGADAEGNVHTYIKWTLTDVDTAAAGSGFVQADYIISGTTVKTWVYKYFILPSLGITGDVPDPYEDILEEIEAQVSAVQTAAASAAASAAQASAEATRIISTTQEVVEDWLSEHIVTGYTVDDTLTISGAAADSATVGTQLRAAFVTETTSGSIASFADGADGVPLKDLVVNISPVQSGTGDPSPSNVRAISGYTAANITRAGRNLLKYNIPTYPGLTITENADGSFHVSGKPTNNGSIYLWNNANNPIIVPEGATYYWGWNPSAQASIIMSTANDSLAFQASYNMSKAINAGAYVACRIYVNSANTYDFDFKPIISIDGDGTFEKPTDNDTYNISFGSAGTVYGGNLDVTSGMLTVTHTIVDLGTVSFTTGTGDGFTVFMHQFSDKALNYNYVCSNYATVPTGRYEITNNGIGTYNATNARNYICIRDDSKASMTAAEFQSAMSGVQFCYEVTQPISVQLDPVSVASLLGNNNIFADCGTVDCEYRADTKLYLEKLTNPDDDMVANANITSGSYFMVGNSLYLATANIANGGAITPGTNCTATNLAAALNAINS